jgi:hypothetical protein
VIAPGDRPGGSGDLPGDRFEIVPPVLAEVTPGVAPAAGMTDDPGSSVARGSSCESF